MRICSSARPLAKQRISNPGSGDVTIVARSLLVSSPDSDAGAPNEGRCRTKYASAPPLRLWLVIDAMKKHCQKKSSPDEWWGVSSLLPGGRIASLKLLPRCSVRSKSSLVSSSKPGRSASIIDRIAGRSDRESSFRKNFSRRSRNGERTDREAKDRVGAKPGRYSGRSLESPSRPIVSKTYV